MKKNVKWAERFISVILMLGVLMGMLAPTGVVRASQLPSVDNNIETSRGEPVVSPVLTELVQWPVYSWGQNGVGQLGTIASDTCVALNCSKFPLPVSGPVAKEFIAVDAGAYHTLALASDGTVWAWGLNDMRQLGVDTTETCGAPTIPCSTTPIQVASLSNVTAIAAGDFFSMALTADGTVYGWGQNSTGQIGHASSDTCVSSLWGGDYECRKAPTVITGFVDDTLAPLKIKAISAGYAHSLAIDENDNAWAWGWNEFGTLGYPTTALCDFDKCSRTPNMVPGMTGVAAVAAGGADSLAVIDGSVYSWGINNHGQLGATSTETCLWSDDFTYYPCSQEPLQVGTLTDIVAIAASHYGLDNNYGFNMALDSTGKVYTWGPNEFGQLGDGTTTEKLAPVEVTGISGVSKIDAGFWHAIAWKQSDDSVWTWGKNSYAQLGNGTTEHQLTPLEIASGAHILGFSGGGHHSVLFTDLIPVYTINGTVYDNQATPHPLAGVAISFNGTTPPTTTISAADGVYTLTGILEGSAGQLSASKAGFDFNGPIDIGSMSANLTDQNFTALKSAPVAVDDTYNTAVEETLLTVDEPGVLANDTDNDLLDGKTAVLVSDPSNGTLVLNSNGSFTYLPNDNFVGTDTFTYKVNDGTFDSNVATVTIDVANVNDAPVAVDDSFSTDEDTLLTVAVKGVLENDTDNDGNTLTSVNTSDPDHGTLTLNPDGSFTYDPADNWNGVDTFKYKANDGTVDSNEATVTVTVGAINDAPVAFEDNYAAEVDNIINVNAANGVLKNDIDVEGDALTATMIEDSVNGHAVLNSDGSFIFNPFGGFNGTARFTYYVSDGTAASNTATVYLKMDMAPKVANDEFSMDEDGDLIVTTAGVLANDTDDDLDPLTAVLVAGPEHGVLNLNDDGTFTYSPEDNWFGSDHFTYKANDSVLELEDERHRHHHGQPGQRCTYRR